MENIPPYTFASVQPACATPQGWMAERRCELRRAHLLEVVLYCPGVGLIHALGRDVSAHGMFVEIEDAIILPRNAVVELFVTAKVKGRDVLCRLSGVVEHVSDQGLGLQFCKVDVNFSRYIETGLAK